MLWESTDQVDIDFKVITYNRTLVIPGGKLDR